MTYGTVFAILEEFLSSDQDCDVPETVDKSGFEFEEDSSSVLYQRQVK